MPRPFAKKKTFMDHAADFAESAIESLESAYDQAKVAAKEAGTSAKETAGPALADARERAVPYLQEGRAVAAEKASAGAAAAKVAAAAGAAAAVEMAAQTRDAASTKLAEAKGEPDATTGSPKRGGKLKKLLFFGALAALGGFIFSKLRSGSEEDNWQSSYVPPPPPAPVPSPTDSLADPLNDPLPGQEATDDPGGAGPDEALADAVDGPHEASTPDEPAEVVELDEGETSKT